MLCALPLLIVGLAAIGTAYGQDANRTATESNASLSISLPKGSHSVKTGSPILISVSLTNTSYQKLAFTKEIHGQDLRVDVRDSKGKLAADTKRGYLWNGHVAHIDPALVDPRDLTGNMVFVTLKTGDTTYWMVDATNLYDMSQPGKYTIQIKRLDPENPALALFIKSNTIVVTVTP